MGKSDVFNAINSIGGRVIDSRGANGVEMTAFSHNGNIFDLVIVGSRVKWFYTGAGDVVASNAHRREAVKAIRRLAI